MKGWKWKSGNENSIQLKICDSEWKEGGKKIKIEKKPTSPGFISRNQDGIDISCGYKLKHNHWILQKVLVLRNDLCLCPLDALSRDISAWSL